jgi:hypothetical protein
MATTHKLTIIPYLQQWRHTTRTLAIRLLVVSSGNPLAPLTGATPAVPAFADAKFAFSVNISDSVGALPQRTLVDQVTIVPDAAGANPTVTHPNSRPIFAAIQEALEIPDTPAADTFSVQSRDMNVQVRKYLPKSYQQSFSFVKPRTSLAVIDDTYYCLMNCPPEEQPPFPPLVVGWGEALAFAVRNPRLAEALGLIVPLDIQIDAAPRLENGGWMWVDLAAASDYFTEQTANPDIVRSFATRIPALPVGAERPVFTPVVFPVSKDAGEAAALGNFDKVFVEAVRFDDGFSKIVHARQPLSANILDEEGTGTPIVRDEGVQLAWDDEDILEGQNRALGAPPDGEDAVLAPRGILGYRVDVRPEGGATWTSLSRVRAPLTLGVELGEADEERWTEVAPAEHSRQIWLPAWFANWRGGSLVVETTDEQRLMNVYPIVPEPAVPLDANNVELRYGNRYEFRVRLADTTGGGPDVDGAPSRAGEAPIALLHMKRHRKPSVLEIDPYTPDAKGMVSTLRFHRPRLGYPEAEFAAGSSARTALLARIAANDAGAPGDAMAPTIHDPDTPYLNIRVLLRLPGFDPAANEEGYVEWYTTTRRFPTDPRQPIDLSLTWYEAANYKDININGQFGADGTISGSLTLIKSRDIRLELRALGRNDLSYFAHDAARIGAINVLDFHAVANVEPSALRTLPPSTMLRSVYLQPDFLTPRAQRRAVVAQNAPSPALIERLGAALDLVTDGNMMTGAYGERIAFGCAGLSHYVAPDNSSIEFSDASELAEKWINVVTVVIDRDWTWRGAGSPTLVIKRTISLPDAVAVADEVRTVGTIELMNAINKQATKDPQRDFTRMIFFDVFAPRMGFNDLPYETIVSYQATVTFTLADSVTQTVENRLPIVTPPKQVPEIVAAGIALTPYDHDKDYRSTQSREKRLWLEFKEPLGDPRDAWFVKPLHITPDPMLLPKVEPIADPVVVEGVPLSPELVRVITPGQVQDLAGLSTMQRLEPSPTSNRHFLVPLPPNTHISSPELFSFYTYEICAGHDAGSPSDPLWSTEQGRFGERLVLEGVQHPAPELPCTVLPEKNGGIRIRAPYATPYVGLRQVLPKPPNTELWAVLYAQVAQADAVTNRNIQIDLRRLHLPRVRKSAILATPDTVTVIDERPDLIVEGISKSILESEFNFVNVDNFEPLDMPEITDDIYESDSTSETITPGLIFNIAPASKPLVIEGEVIWTGHQVASALKRAGLPNDSPISALVVELLPEPNGTFNDPLGGDLGQVRILRTSPLSSVDRNCCN